MSIISDTTELLGTEILQEQETTNGVVFMCKGRHVDTRRTG
jgi:hypothetical protein